MVLFRLFLLFFLGLLLRRFWLSLTGARHTRRSHGSHQESTFRDASRTTDNRPGQDSPRSSITEQKIDDADFEEIP
ncbi:hypothetical protein CSA17_03675 [bacterium DOLJORAL78_65_58]|nr:MAG: hypothetical protein CSB20_07570 [bacterium DOLZORAL124_64_63]PIE76158.1 MAG: hypothetical protein CSA17_03675 [bacterium DOLJORAL78_65_58]